MPRDIDTILARFPGPVTLTASRRKWIGMLAIAVGFVAIAIFMLYRQPADFGSEGILVAWSGMVFFGLCGLVSIVMLLPGAGALTLSAEGFETTSLFRTSRTPWSAASDFTVVHMPGDTAVTKGPAMVGYELAKSPSAFADMNRSILGRNEALPDTYGFSTEEL